MKPTQPLRDEHAELLPRVEILRIVAESAPSFDRGGFLASTGSAEEFLSSHLIPHARAEEAVLYPAVAPLLGGPLGTRTMSRDHEEVVALTHALRDLRARVERAGLTPAAVREAQRILYGLYALLHVHFAKEEDIYLPLLDAALSAAEARELFRRMEEAAAGTRVAAH